MAKSNKYSSKITSLENELLTVRHELALLQSSRSHRIAKFSRQLISSSPADIPKVLKQLPNLLQKAHVPSPDGVQERVDLFNPLNNPLPLYRYPNINVAFVGKLTSRIGAAFSQTCNTAPLNSTHIHELMNYNALQLVVVDYNDYDKQSDSKLIGNAVESGAHLVVIQAKETILPRELTSLKPTIIRTGVDQSDIMPFADIYSLEQKAVPRTVRVDESSLNIVDSPDAITRITHESVSILDADFIKNISFEDACRVLEKIASYCPVVLKGNRPDWIPDNIRSLSAADSTTKTLKDLAEPYAAERYAINCARQIVVSANALKQISKQLLGISLIDKLPESPKISIILSMRRPQFLKQILEQLEKQTLRPYEVILMLHGVPSEESDNINQILKDTSLNVKYEFVDESVLFGDVLNMAIDKASGEFSTKIDDDDYYLPNHLLDLYAAHLSSRADFVGKWNHWVHIQADNETISWTPENANMYVRHIPGGTLFGRTATFKTARFGKVRRAIDSELYRRAARRGAVLYSTHKYNYIRVRHDDHTYTATNADFKSRADNHTIRGLPFDSLGA